MTGHDGRPQISSSPIGERQLAHIVMAIAATAGADMTAFRQSRIYAEGWNAARTSSLDAEPRGIATLNPYRTDPERARWNDGFRAAAE